MTENTPQPIVYTQRYETYRHLDKLFWQMFQLAITTVAIFATIVKISPSQIEVAMTFGGIIWIALGTAMFRLRTGMNMNSKILSSSGKSLGDESIPITNHQNFSSFLASIVVIAGILSFIIGGFIWICH